MTTLDRNLRPHQPTALPTAALPPLPPLKRMPLEALAPRHVEERLKSIVRGLRGHSRGRDPSEQDVHLIALLIDHLPHDDPALANQHILDVVLPLDYR